MNITLKENNENKFLGRIVAPWKCCEFWIEINDANNNLLYILQGKCW